MSKNIVLVAGFIAAVAIGAGGHYLYSKATSNDLGATSSLSAKAKDDKSAVILTVNGKDVTQTMFDERKAFIASRTGALFAQLPAAEQDRVIKENLILEILVDQNMEGSDVAADPKVAEQLNTSRLQILRTAYLDKAADAAITEESLRASYDAQVAKLPDVEEVRARHILVKDEGVAADLIDQLNNGASFEELAATNSLDKGNASQGGDLGYFTKDLMVPEFANVAFAMNAGELSSEPVKTSFGYHVIKLEDKRVKPKPTFEEVREGLMNEERQKVIKQLVEKWRKEAVVVDNSAPATADTQPAPEAVNAEPTQAEPVEAEPAQVGPAQAEPAQEAQEPAQP